jgi:Flp pilus assembly secretin CpaC
MTARVGRQGKSHSVPRDRVFLAGSVCVLISVLITGCGDFFGTKPTEMESRNLLRELETVKLTPNLDIPLPDVYKQPPKIVETVLGDAKDARLYYFSRYHSVDKLKGLVDAQFLRQFMGDKNKIYPMPDYNVAIHPATNQIVVRCPSVEDAQQVLKFLQKVDVPPIQIKIDCLISEVYADHTLDWETQVQIQNLFGQQVNLSGKMPGAALRDLARSSFGMKTGYVGNGTYDSTSGTFVVEPGQEGHMFGAMVDVLVSRGYLKILMNPQLEVVNGQSANIVTSEHVPLDVIQSVHPVSGVITQRTEYVDVVDSLTITPRVFADGYIGIETRAVIGSKSTPEGVKQVPIVTKREVVVKENRIRQGESLVIGGIRKTEQRSVVRGVPFLKDIPLIGILFSSKDFEERGKEVMFVLTPTISTGGVPNEEVVADIQSKHTPAGERNDLSRSWNDPLGTGMYTDIVEEEATRAEVGRVKAEMQKAHAERTAKQLEEQLGRATEQVEQEKSRANQAEAASKTTQQAVDAQKAKTTAVVAETAKSAEELKKLEESAAAAKADAERLKAEAAAAKEAAAKAKKDAEGQIEKWSNGKNGGAAPKDAAPAKPETPNAGAPQDAAPAKPASPAPKDAAAKPATPSPAPSAGAAPAPVTPAPAAGAAPTPAPSAPAPATPTPATPAPAAPAPTAPAPQTPAPVAPAPAAPAGASPAK